MRAEWLKKLTPEWNWTWFDTDAPMRRSARMWRSLAFRCHAGLAVSRINDDIIAHLGSSTFELIWIDKGVFLRNETVQQLRKSTKRLVHFTPDAAFRTNVSRHFEHSLSLYDLLVTTKSFELGDYARRVGADHVMLTTQGFDPQVHYPRTTDDQRRREVAFVGLAEADRERCLEELLAREVPVRLAGRGWAGFLRRAGNDPNLTFVGEECYGDDYARLLSSVWVGLGLISKKFPELHTTRTFEIPACGAALATENTAETRQYFHADEAIFFDNYSTLADRLKKLLTEEDIPTLRRIAASGHRRVISDQRDYGSILSSILSHEHVRVQA